MCKLFMSDDYCDHFFPHIFALYYPNLLKLIDPVRTCSSWRFCDRPIIKLDENEEFARRVLRNKPPNQKGKSQISGRSIKILVVNDAHVDFEYQEGANGECASSTCCRKVSSALNVPAGKWGHLGGCDLPVVFMIPTSFSEPWIHS